MGALLLGILLLLPGIVLGLIALRGFLLCRRLTTTARRKRIRDLAVENQLVVVTGEVLPGATGAVIAPWSGRTCVWLFAQVYSSAKKLGSVHLTLNRGRAFYLSDGQARVRVQMEPPHAVPKVLSPLAPTLELTNWEDRRLHALMHAEGAKVRRGLRFGSVQVAEQVIELGQEIHVFGEVVRAADGVLELVGTGPRKVLYLSPHSEEALMRQARRGAKLMLAWNGGGLILILWGLARACGWV